MSSIAKIPHGDDKVTVELTIKELMALTGTKFYASPNIEISARQKLNRVLDAAYGQGHGGDKSPFYQMLS